MTSPFYITYEKKDKQIEELIENTFLGLEAIGEVKIPRKHMGSKWSNGDFGSVAWYVKNAYNSRRKQANLSDMFILTEQEPWQKTNPHFELMVLETDLFDEETNFVYGAAQKKIVENGRIVVDGLAHPEGRLYVPGIIISANRMKKGHGKNWESTFLTMFFHELGHFFGLPTTSNPNYMKEGDSRANGYLDFKHCDDSLCVMEQVDIDGRMNLLKKTKLLEKENLLYFCEHDFWALRENLRKLYK